MNIHDLIKITESHVSPVDFETVNPSTISWAAVGDVDTATVREFATELLRKADQVDFSKIEISPEEHWKVEMLFDDARMYCFSLNIDGKVGWRLPTLIECEIMRKQADNHLLDQLVLQNWVFTSTEPFYEEERYNIAQVSRKYGSNDWGEGPITTYGFHDDEYDFEDIELERGVIPVRDV